ncbi:hypothetical protein [Burkholderia anthina]|uniref:hypothetical protein n=1 Tax=Burkholderia anthina TaxID=179879 RepID=UPI001E50A714|nr:hypothetical protein [Burkholderia anthina]
MAKLVSMGAGGGSIGGGSTGGGSTGGGSTGGGSTGGGSTGGGSTGGGSTGGGTTGGGTTGGGSPGTSSGSVGAGSANSTSPGSGRGLASSICTTSDESSPPQADNVKPASRQNAPNGKPRRKNTTFMLIDSPRIGKRKAQPHTHHTVRDQRYSTCHSRFE